MEGWPVKDEVLEKKNTTKIRDAQMKVMHVFAIAAYRIDTGRKYTAL